MDSDKHNESEKKRTKQKKRKDKEHLAPKDEESPQSSPLEPKNEELVPETSANDAVNKTGDANDNTSIDNQKVKSPKLETVRIEAITEEPSKLEELAPQNSTNDAVNKTGDTKDGNNSIDNPVLNSPMLETVRIEAITEEPSKFEQLVTQTSTNDALTVDSNPFNHSASIDQPRFSNMDRVHSENIDRSHSANISRFHSERIDRTQSSNSGNVHSEVVDSVNFDPNNGSCESETIVPHSSIERIDSTKLEKMDTEDVRSSGKIELKYEALKDDSLRQSPQQLRAVATVNSPASPESRNKHTYTRAKSALKLDATSDSQLSKEAMEKKGKKLVPTFGESKNMSDSNPSTNKDTSVLSISNQNGSDQNLRSKKRNSRASFNEIVKTASINPDLGQSQEPIEEMAEQVSPAADPIIHSDEIRSSQRKIGEFSSRRSTSTLQNIGYNSDFRVISSRQNSMADMPHSKSSLYSADNVGTGKELVEGFASKVMGMKFTLFALLANGLLLYVLFVLYSSSGLQVGFGAGVKHVGPVIIQTWMHISHYLTERSLTEASGVYIGWLMARPEGYSLAACAFVHASTYEKLSFTSNLSFKSKCKSLLQKTVYVWFIHILVLLITVLSSTTVTDQGLRVDAGTSQCVLYEQNDIPFDRGIPTKNGAVGVAEYVFGMSLGRMRSQEDVPYTTHIFPPQLADAADDGSSIVGRGFSTKVETVCDCSNSLSPEHLVASGVNSVFVSDMLSKVRELNRVVGLVSSLEYSAANETVKMVSLITNIGVCGGRNATNPGVPVCTTMLSEHSHAEVLARYITDGTPASIAIAYVEVREILGKADMSWLYAALENYLGGQVSTFILPETIPGIINPMLWWATPNMIQVSPSLLEAGFETTIAMILRPSIQRSYSVRGSLCTQNIINPNASVFFISSFGLTFGLIFTIIEILINLLCIVMAVPWFMKKNPIGPAIKLASDKNYFTLMMASKLGTQLISGVMMTANVSTIWPKMDVFMRVGESIRTKDDPEFGQITIDKPKMVTDFVVSKTYT
jgi:hypothetical protein